MSGMVLGARVDQDELDMANTRQSDGQVHIREERVLVTRAVIRVSVKHHGDWEEGPQIVARELTGAD